MKKDKITFEQFERIYIDCLGAFSQDRNPCFRAFQAASAIALEKYGATKYTTYGAFKACLSRHRKAKRASTPIQVSRSAEGVSKTVN